MTYCAFIQFLQTRQRYRLAPSLHVDVVAGWRGVVVWLEGIVVSARPLVECKVRNQTDNGRRRRRNKLHVTKYMEYVVENAPNKGEYEDNVRKCG